MHSGPRRVSHRVAAPANEVMARIDSIVSRHVRSTVQVYLEKYDYARAMDDYEGIAGRFGENDFCLYKRFGYEWTPTTLCGFVEESHTGVTVRLQLRYTAARYFIVALMTFFATVIPAVGGVIYILSSCCPAVQSWVGLAIGLSVVCLGIVPVVIYYDQQFRTAGERAMLDRVESVLADIMID